MSSLRERNPSSSRSEALTRRENGQPSNQFNRSSKSKVQMIISPEDCIFCGSEFVGKRKLQFASLINMALYSKFSSSQNYYYAKDVNEILGEMRTPAVLLFTDYVHYDEEEEYLKRFYKYAEYPTKIAMLTEYYKFHNDIPRVFMHPLVHVINRYHDTKRRLEYVRVTKLLKLQNPDQESYKEEKSSQSESDRETNPRPTLVDRILDDLDLTEEFMLPKPKVKVPPGLGKNLQEYINKLAGSDKFIDRKFNPMLTGRGDYKPQQKVKPDQKDASMSNTLHDLNQKLGEIINSRLIERSYFESQAEVTNDSISNLQQFLKHVNKNGKEGAGMLNIPGINPPNLTDIIQNKIPKATILKSPVANKMPITMQTLAQTALERPKSAYNPNIANDLQAKLGKKLERNVKPFEAVSSATSTTVTSSKQNSKVTTAKEPEKVRDRAAPTHNSALGSSQGTPARQQSQPSSIERQKILASGITKIKDFEIAMKQHLQNVMVRTSSLPKENTLKQQERAASALSSKNTSRVNNTPREKIKKPTTKSRESAAAKQRMEPPASAMGSRSGSKTKLNTRDFGMKGYDLAVDSTSPPLMMYSSIGREPVDIGKKSVTRSRKGSTTGDKGSKRASQAEIQATTISTYNNTQMSTQGQQQQARPRIFGTGDYMTISRTESGGLTPAMKMTANRLMSDTLFTEREGKKSGGFGMIDIEKMKGTAPATARERPKDFGQFAIGKDSSSMLSKSGYKGISQLFGDLETLRKTDLNTMRSQVSETEEGQKKLTRHKYTKSDGRLKRADMMENMDTVESMRTASKGRTSPKRQNYTYNNNNIVNVFVNGNDKAVPVKKDLRTVKQELLLNYNDDLLKYNSTRGGVYTSREATRNKSGTATPSLTKKLSLANYDFASIKSSRVSPYQSTQKDIATSRTRDRSAKSSSNFPVDTQRSMGKTTDFRTIKKDLRIDDYTGPYTSRGTGYN